MLANSWMLAKVERSWEASLVDVVTGSLVAGVRRSRAARRVDMGLASSAIVYACGS